MERWAANTLRIVGIILTSLVVVCGCLFLVLLSRCAAQGGFEGSPNNNAATNYMFCAVLLGVAGITFIAWLARGIYRSSRLPQPAAAAPQPSTPQPPSPSVPALHLSPASRRAVNLLIGALTAQLVLTALDTLYSVIRFQQNPFVHRSVIPVSIVSAALFVVPYAILIYFVRWHLSPAVLSFALGVPAASVIDTLIVITPVIHLYVRNPVNLPLLVAPLIIDLAIIALTYQTQQRTGMQSPVSSLLTTVVVSFVYFYTLHLLTRMLYRM